VPELHLQIVPRDPVVIRDGRPFGSGATKMRALPWPYPQTVSSSLRTLLGKLQSHGFDANGIERLLQLRISGAFPEKDNLLYFPAPSDLLCAPDGPPVSLRPVLNTQEGAEASVLKPDLLPSLPFLPLHTGEFKPAEVKPFLPAAWMVNWLLENLESNAANLTQGERPAHTEIRTHVQIDPSTGAARDEMLFSTVGLRLQPDFSLSFRVRGEADDLAPITRLRAYHPFGGERRLAWFQTCPRLAPAWECPIPIRAALSNRPSRVRLVLGTPGIFANGWLPKWLQENSIVPGTGTVRLRLISAAINRWLPVSGWSYDRRTFGAKPIRRMVPAGSVYFCEVLPGSDPAELASLWLEPVCDHEQDGRDGYGLALWGIWNPHA
jgi:CRISPR-associated protein Cmr3